MFRAIAIAAMSLLPGSVVAAEHAHHWSYSGSSGPSHWAALDHAFAGCAQGKAQSPVGIDTHHVVTQALPPIIFDYHPSALRIIDNGHTIQVNAGAGSAIKIGDDRYELVQFHFHHPSEEKIDGRASDMVAHLVHRDAQGRLAVVAVLLQQGRENPLIATLWHNHPRQLDHEEVIKGVSINPAALLPADRSYFSYAGSLTTPPCSEGVRWLVLKTPVTLSPAEVAAFAKKYPNNARPIQPLNGRRIVASSSR